MIELNPVILTTILLYANSVTSTHLSREWQVYNDDDDDPLYKGTKDRLRRRINWSNTLGERHSDHEPPNKHPASPLPQRLTAREARGKGKASPAPKSNPQPQPQPAKPDKKAAEKAAKEERKKQQEAAKADKKAKEQAAKADKQKKKDQKMVTDNMARERKAQDKAGAEAIRKTNQIKAGYNKGIDKENRDAGREKKHAESDLSRAQREVAQQKGKKGAKKAQEKLSRAQNWVSNLENNHNGRLKQLASKTNGELGKNSHNLNKAMTKAHTNEFDANGRAKEHLNAWQKFKKVAKTIAIEGAMALGGAVLSVIPGGAIAFAGMTAARIAAQTGIRAGVQGAKAGSKAAKAGTKAGKKGGKEGQKQTPKEGAPLPVDWRAQNAEQIAQSQKNNDLHKANLKKTDDSIMANIHANLGQKISKREAMQPLYLDLDENDEAS